MCTWNYSKPAQVSKMAHHNDQSRTPQTSHHLQDDSLFSLSGEIPPEHFDDLNFVSMKREKISGSHSNRRSLGILR